MDSVKWASKIIGGYGSTNHKKISIFGGANKKERNFIVGDKATFHMKQKIIDWNTFLEIYDQLDDKHYTNLIKEVVSILKLPAYTNDRILIPLLRKIYNLEDDAIITRLLKENDVHESVAIVARSIFMKLIHLYEYLVKEVMKEIGIDFKKHMTKWKAYEKKHNLNSTSVLLLSWSYNLLESKIKNYKGPNATIIHKIVNELTHNEWRYLGFCPKVPIYRILVLLRFPIHLFEQFLSKSKKIKINSDIVNYIKSLKKPEYPIYISRTKRETPPKFKNQAEQIIWYVSKILDLQFEVTKYIEKVELYYVDVSENLSDIDKYLSKIKI